VGTLTAIAPFFVGLVLRWIAAYPFHRTMHEWNTRNVPVLDEVTERRSWRLLEYLDYTVRHNLLFIAVPVSLIILLQDVIRLYGPRLLGESQLGEMLMTGGTIAAAAAVFFFAPPMIVRIWRTEPLPEGPLRTKLERMCRRLKLRYRDIRIWRSGYMVANAGVMGLTGPVRYILLSDLLLKGMSDQHIKAVFAHEAGHVISHHIFYMAMFAISSAVLVLSVTGLAVDAAVIPPALAEMSTIVLLTVVWLSGFGWLSRRLERQSDVIGAWASGANDEDAREDRISPEGASAFAGALQQVALLNGIPPQQRSWRHGSIRSRINYILQLASHEGRRSETDRRIRRIKKGIWVAFVLAVALGLVDWLVSTPS